MSEINIGKLDGLNGKTVRNWYDWLKKTDCGCCHLEFGNSDDGNVYSVCMGWTDCYGGWKIAWKIGRQKYNNLMQSDLEIDFETPYNEETGDVDDTEETLDSVTDWDSLAETMKRTARRVWNDWGV
jgi:hypothetical protein